jgi:hypothetical protein
VATPATARSKDESLRDVATDIVWKNIRGQYGQVWARLHPRYQRVTTREFWENCQRKKNEPRTGVDWLSIRVVSTYPDHRRFPLLGLTNVTAVAVTARIQYLGAKHTITDTNYWVKIGGKWRGSWDPETYRAYAKKRCPPN